MALPSPQECVAALDRLAPGAAAGSVLVLGLAGLAVLAMRRASAAARHEVWVLGFAGVLLLPILSATLPGWHVLPRPGTSRPTARAAGVGEDDASSPLPVAALSQAEPSSLVPAGSTPSKETTTVNTKDDLPGAVASPPAAIAPTASPQPTPPVSPAPVERSEGLPWTAWVLPSWAAGSLLVLCRVLLGHLSLWWMRRGCVAVTRGELFDQCEQVREELRLRRPVELLSSPARTVPMTWGLWRARLLIPGQAADWSPDRRRDVLLHELGHVRRQDCLAQFLAHVACAVYWFNPLAWVAGRRMGVERERACDDLVLNTGAAAPSYARHLLQSVSPVPAPRLAGAAVAMARQSTLEERMRAILNPRLNRRGLTRRGSLAMALLLLSALVPAAALRAQQDATQALPATRAPARAARGDGSGPPESPATRPAGDPQTARPGFGGGRTRGGGFGGAATPALGEGPTCTLDATIYDVRLPVDQVGRLDVDALAKASESAEAFEKALAALGTTKPLYRANQSVRLSGDTITIGSQVPVVTSSRATDKGQTVNTIQYQSTGAIFTLAGKTGAPGGLDLDLAVEVSSISDGGAAITDTVKAPITRTARLSHKGPNQPRKPFVVVSVDAGSPDKDGKAVAYIARITVGEPQPPAAK